jgi:hypothetical protein
MISSAKDKNKKLKAGAVKNAGNYRPGSRLVKVRRKIYPANGPPAESKLSAQIRLRGNRTGFLGASFGISPRIAYF